MTEPRRDKVSRVGRDKASRTESSSAQATAGPRKVTSSKSSNLNTVEDIKMRILSDMEQGFGGTDEFRDIFSGRLKPVSEAWVNNMGREMVQWAANDPKAYKIGQFLTQKGLDWEAIDRWRTKFPSFDSTYRAALSIIGDRREIGGLENKLNANIVSFRMPHYDRSWKKMAEWR